MISYADLNDPISIARLGFLYFNGKASGDRFSHICHKLFHRFTLRRTAGNCRYFGPKAALFRVVDDNFEFHTPYFIEPPVRSLRYCSL